MSSAAAVATALTSGVPANDLDDASYHAHPQQQITDDGPQRRHSRLALFDHVRTMLQNAKSTSQSTSSRIGNDRPKWDAYTGELSDMGQPSRVQPSTYVNPHETLANDINNNNNNNYNAAPATPNRFSKLNVDISRESSPVSLLHEESIKALRKDPDEWSSVSSIHRTSVDQTLVPKPLTPRLRQPLQPQTPTSTNSGRPIIKRKPAPRSVSKTENTPPAVPVLLQPFEMDEPYFVDHRTDAQQLPAQPKSHFSWTTYAPSVYATPGRKSNEILRKSIDSKASPPSHLLRKEYYVPKSHFSWSTVNTTPSAGHARHSSPPTSPLPPIPARFAKHSPPVQSILSRRRPVQRHDRADWAPPKRDRKVSAPLQTLTTTAISREEVEESLKTKRAASLTPTSTTISPLPKTGKSKALPPPPSLAPAVTQKMTHLETLLKREQDLALQHRNIDKIISELERLEAASPMTVSWAALGDARKSLQHNRSRLAEITCEERDVGVAISRARRKEGSEEGLWVRRVTS